MNGTTPGQAERDALAEALAMFHKVAGLTAHDPRWFAYATPRQIAKWRSIVNPTALDEAIAAQPQRGAAGFEDYMKARGCNPDLTMVCSNFGPDDLRDAFEAGMQAQRDASPRQPEPAPGPHHCTSTIECEDCKLRAAVLAEIEAAADSAAADGDADCEVHADAILAIVADAYAGTKPAQPAPGLPVYLGRRVRGGRLTTIGELEGDHDDRD